MSQGKESSQKIGVYLHRLRKERKLTLKEVSIQLGIDVSTLSKIENGERELKAHMIKPLAELFKLEFRDLKIEFLNRKIMQEFGDEPFLNEALQILATVTK
jgi:transcriptional regulator with XRE-family HTH domain